MLEKQMWMKYAPEITVEWKQLWDEGKDVAPYRAACEKIAALAEQEECEEQAAELLQKMQQAPTRPGYPYREPSDYESIAALSAGIPPQPVPDTEILRDKIKGAWIGRIAGCLLGKPFEMLRSATIDLILESTQNHPMNRYVDSREFPPDLPARAGMEHFEPWQKCWVDTIGDAAPVDDDTNYTVFALKLVETYGRDFRPNDVLEGWLSWLPMFSTCTAERVAYRNAAAGMTAPATATHRNPYREWIGAQIRGDFFGYINPGAPRKAAEMAWRDACISHVKNGIYGEMFAAAMIAQAAVCSDVVEIVRAGLAQIPSTSRLAEEIGSVLQWKQSGQDWEQVVSAIRAKYDENVQHDWCHTNSNAMLVTAALLYGEGDFGRSICLAVQSAFDTDCNGATVGSVVGMMNGAKAIPAVWTDAFHGMLHTSIDGYQNVSVEQLAQKTMQLL